MGSYVDGGDSYLQKMHKHFYDDKLNWLISNGGSLTFSK